MAGPDVDLKTSESGGIGGGLPCPTCGTPIKITLESLILRQNFRCSAPGCNMTLTLDRQASRDAISQARVIRTKQGL